MRLLLVSYYFPPFNSVGAVRPGKLAAFLHARGHDVHVLSGGDQPFPTGLALEVPADRVTAVAGWSVNAPAEWLRGGRDRVAREGFGATTGAASALGRLGRLYRTALHWPDGQVGWVGAALRAGRELLRRHRFDAIYVSSPPFSALRVGATLAREAGVPWVAEFRDLWTDNHAYHQPAWRRALERRWEASLLRSASALVTVSSPLVAQLARFGLPVWEVRNGFDAEDFEGLPRPQGFGSTLLDVVFTGNIYEGHYDLEAFCAGLAQEARDGGRVRVHVAGRNTGGLRDAAQRHGVVDAFAFHGTLPRRDALAMQRHADVLLAFLWQGGHEGVYSAKLFEYAGAGRPVLAVGPANDVAALVRDSGLGRTAADAGAVAQALEAFRQRKRSAGELRAVPAPGYDFSRTSQFQALERRLADLLRRS